MKIKCSECGMPFRTQMGEGQIFCSSPCQLKRDTLECDPRIEGKGRQAKTTPRIPKTNIPAC